nr:MAG TPA: hypothetical protein [Caudoviricetes sp.]
MRQHKSVKKHAAMRVIFMPGIGIKLPERRTR